MHVCDLKVSLFDQSFIGQRFVAQMRKQTNKKQATKKRVNKQENDASKQQAATCQLFSVTVKKYAPPLTISIPNSKFRH
jgi:predicted membrane metal-binding protein